MIILISLRVKGETLAVEMQWTRSGHSHKPIASSNHTGHSSDKCKRFVLMYLYDTHNSHFSAMNANHHWMSPKSLSPSLSVSCLFIACTWLFHSEYTSEVPTEIDCLNAVDFVKPVQPLSIWLVCWREGSGPRVAHSEGWQSVHKEVSLENDNR